MNQAVPTGMIQIKRVQNQFQILAQGNLSNSEWIHCLEQLKLKFLMQGEREGGVGITGMPPFRPKSVT